MTKAGEREGINFLKEECFCQFGSERSEATWAMRSTGGSAASGGGLCSGREAIEESDLEEEKKERLN